MTYLVTGASSGIGQATVIALAKQGHRVLAIARRAQLLESLASQYPNVVTPLSVDIATPEGIEAIVKSVDTSEQLFGIVHAAGTTVDLANYIETDTAKLVDDMAVHVAAPIAINKILGKKLIGARIVYIDSYSAQAPRVGWASYSILKAAAQMAARAAAEELADSTVVRVYPGGVNTPLVKAVLSSDRTSPTVDTFKELKANGKLTDPKDIGEYVLNILTRASPEELASRDVWDFNNDDDRIFE